MRVARGGQPAPRGGPGCPGAAGRGAAVPLAVLGRARPRRAARWCAESALSRCRGDRSLGTSERGSIAPARAGTAACGIGGRPGRRPAGDVRHPGRPRARPWGGRRSILCDPRRLPPGGDRGAAGTWTAAPGAPPTWTPCRPAGAPPSSVSTHGLDCRCPAVRGNGVVSRSMAAVEALALERRGARVDDGRAGRGLARRDRRQPDEPEPRAQVIAAGLAQGRRLGSSARAGTARSGCPTGRRPAPGRRPRP